MATDIASSATAHEPRSFGEQFTRLCVSRRVPITIGLLALLLILDGYVFHGRPRDIFNWTDPVAAMGVLAVFFGLLVRSWAAGTLKKQKQLATTGPYAWIRHPLYFGSSLMMVGFAALGFDPLSLAVVGPPIAWMYWQAIRSEDRNICRLFPTEWPSYAANVPGIIPRRLTWPRFDDWSRAQWLRNTEYQAWMGAAAALFALKMYQLLW